MKFNSFMIIVDPRLYICYVHFTCNFQPSLSSLASRAKAFNKDSR